MRKSRADATFDMSMVKLSSYTSVDSTNNRVKEAIAQGMPEWTVITSLVQERGYGRQGRTWTSPLGGLYVSFLLRPTDHVLQEEFRDQPSFVAALPSLSLVISIAVRRALLSLGVAADDEDPSNKGSLLIKWPNDVLWEYKNDRSRQEDQAIQAKLSGISVEAIDNAVCVGIGINLFRPVEDLSVLPSKDMSSSSTDKYDFAYVAELLKEKTIDSSVAPGGLLEKQAAYMEEVLAVLLQEAHSVYNQWLIEGFSPFRDEYQASASLQGKVVQLVSLSNDVLYEGVVCDVDDQGFLCLIDSKGEVVRAHSGEVHLK